MLRIFAFMEDDFDFLKDAIAGNSHNNQPETPPEKIDTWIYKLPDGREVTVKNGQYKHPDNGRMLFAPGNNIAKKGAGILRPKSVTVFRESMRVENWKALGEYIEGNGIKKYITEMESLEGREYVVAYLGILAFVKPKIANVEIKEDKKLKGVSKGHTITIKDMRDGSEKKTTI